MPPTNNDSSTRTEDPTNPSSFLYTPWRSPGHAPTADPCGLAGGTSPEHQGPGVAVFTPNGVAKQGDKGSETLKPGPPVETWARGTSVEVAWGIRFNHGQCTKLAAAPFPCMLLNVLTCLFVHLFAVLVRRRIPISSMPSIRAVNRRMFHEAGKFALLCICACVSVKVQFKHLLSCDTLHGWIIDVLVSRSSSTARCNSCVGIMAHGCRFRGRGWTLAPIQSALHGRSARHFRFSPAGSVIVRST